MSQDFNLTDPFALLRQFWPGGTVNPLHALQQFMPPMSEAELDRKLAELRVIENWLTMNLGMITMQVRALEAQRNALAALKPKDNS